MTTLIIPITENVEQYNNCLKMLKKFGDELSIVVGVKELFADRVADLKYVKVEKFASNSSKEEIINALTHNIGQGKTVIVRRPFTEQELVQLINSGAQITFCASKKRGKISSFFYGLWEKLIKAVFGIKFFDGDVSLIAFDESCSQVLSTMTNVSYNSRVDRWSATEQATIQAECKPVRFDCKPKTIALDSLYIALSVLIPLVVTLLVALLCESVSVIVGLLLFCIDFLGICLALIFAFTLMFNLKVGEKFVLSASRVD